MALGIEDVLVGHWTDDEAATGVTVVIPPARTLGALAVRGGAPGTREAAALSNIGSGIECHGVALCGNSVFGLSAADGVVRWCVEQERGLLIRGSVVPVVGAAVVYDIQSPTSQRVTAEAGHLACENASSDEPATGRVGVGRGCTVGKSAGRAYSAPGGLGVAACTSGDLSVAVIVAVNPLGDVINRDGSVLAGTIAPEGSERYPYTDPELIPGFYEEAYKGTRDNDPSEAGPGHVDVGMSGSGRMNTTIGCIVTNGALTKPDACRAADLAHTGIARAVEPPHTDFDGDALFLLATGQVPANKELVALLASEAIETAIRTAVQ